ncbi:hypothetical protein ACHAWF_004774 [Thalassiosira exigua]
MLVPPMSLVASAPGTLYTLFLRNRPLRAPGAPPDAPGHRHPIPLGVMQYLDVLQLFYPEIGELTFHVGLRVVREAEIGHSPPRCLARRPAQDLLAQGLIDPIRGLSNRLTKDAFFVRPCTRFISSADVFQRALLVLKWYHDLWKQSNVPRDAKVRTRDVAAREVVEVADGQGVGVQERRALVLQRIIALEGGDVLIVHFHRAGPSPGSIPRAASSISAFPSGIANLSRTESSVCASFFVM